MAYEIEIIEVEPTILASVRQRAAWSALAVMVPKLLGEVWDFLKTAPTLKAGHNVAVYRDANTSDVEVECGVQVSASFGEGSGIRCSKTPSGPAAHVIHLGPYSKLGRAHNAIVEYCREGGYGPGIHWEVYGDWNEDVTKLRTDIYRLVSTGT